MLREEVAVKSDLKCLRGWHGFSDINHSLNRGLSRRVRWNKHNQKSLANAGSLGNLFFIEHEKSC